MVISGRLGLRKKLAILKKIKEKNLLVLNIKDINTNISDIELQLKKRKEKKLEKNKKKQTSKKESLQKSNEINKKEETPEEKEKREKEEKRKVLESKQ